MMILCSDSSENEETFDKVEDDDIANNGKDVDYVIDKEVDGILSTKYKIHERSTGA